MVSRPSDRDRDRALRLIDEYGTNPMSFLVRYEAPWRFHLGTAVEGVVCYQESNGYAMAWCDPVCAPNGVAALFEEFTRAMRGRGLRVCWLAVDARTSAIALRCGYAVLKVAEDPCFDLTTWSPPRGDAGKRLRWSLNRARRAGIAVREYRPGEGRVAAVEAQIAGVETAWSTALGRPVVRSFLRPATFEEAERKRYFVAVAREGDVLAYVSCAPVAARGGWYLEDLVRRPDAPAGATELVVTEALQRLATDGARFATLGLAPLRGFDRQIDRRARWLTRALKLGFVQLDARFHFVSLSRYKSKFRPTSWEPRSAAFLPPRPGIRLAKAALNVLDPPREAGAPPQVARTRSRARALVAVQAVVWLLAGLVVVGGEWIARLQHPGAAAAYVAPAGLAGAVVAALLALTWKRMDRREGVVYRGLLVVLEAVLGVAAIDRLLHRHGPVADVASLVVVAGVLALLAHARRAAAAASIDPYE